jgi:hypothetical protein
MLSSGMLRRVALVRTNVSEELLCSVHRLLFTASIVPSKEALSSSKTSVLTTSNLTNAKVVRQLGHFVPFSVCHSSVILLYTGSCGLLPQQQSMTIYLGLC